MYQNGALLGQDGGVAPSHSVITSVSKKIAFSLIDINEPGDGTGRVKIDDLMMFDSALSFLQITLLKVLVNR